MGQFFVQSIWLIPCYAFIGGFSALPWSPTIISRTGPRPAGYVNLLMTCTAFIHSLIALVLTWNVPPQYESFTWLSTAGLHLSLDLEISRVSIAAMLLVTGLNLLAQIYAIGYMEMDWGLGTLLLPARTIRGWDVCSSTMQLFVL